jgi:hypothetical protein
MIDKKMLPLTTPPDWDPTSPANPWSRPPFIPGLELSRRFYVDAVRPILARDFPTLAYSAALIGYGSDVIGYDDARSRDHLWGPRMILFLSEEGFEQKQLAVDQALRAGLPTSFLGYSTGFGPPNLEDNGTRVLAEETDGPVDHLITLTTLPEYFNRELSWDTRREITLTDWLTFSEHRLLTLTAGGVWHDDLGLATAREQLAYYPHAVWRYLLACQWQQIGQEEPFVGRSAEAGDDLGSRLLAAKMVRCLMRLAFLLERRYTPYSKWFGAAFSRLEAAADLSAHLSAALAADTYPQREENLCAAYTRCAQRFNTLGLIAPVSDQPVWFFSRPFKVIRGGDIAARLRASISDPALRALPLIGSANQFSDSTDLLESVAVLNKLRTIF